MPSSAPPRSSGEWPTRAGSARSAAHPVSHRGQSRRHHRRGRRHLWRRRQHCRPSRSIAEPGGICISGTAFDHAVHKADVGFASLGEQRLKNIADPVRVYRVLLDPWRSREGHGRASRPASALHRSWQAVSSAARSRLPAFWPWHDSSFAPQRPSDRGPAVSQI